MQAEAGRRPGKARHQRVRTLLLATALAGSLPAVAEDIVVGMSAAFSGPSGSLGVELYRGSQAYFDQVNAAGGVHGNRIVVKAYDDAYDPTQAIQNTLKLVEEDDVFLLFNYVGTPTVVRVLPLLKQYADRPMLMFFPFTGAEPQRRPPYSDLVFNLRASYHNETRALVEQLLSLGHQRIGVYYQADAYGRGGWEGVRNALRDAGLDIHAEATYARGLAFDDSVRQQVNILREADSQAVIAICAYAACAAFIRDARDAGWTVPIANVSFSGSEAMSVLLDDHADQHGSHISGRLVTSQVVPSYQDLSLPAVVEYRTAMDQLGAALPEGTEAGYRPEPYSFASLEGYLNARLLVSILDRLGPQPSRAGLKAAAESLHGVDLGIGVELSLDATHHQALNTVFMTTLESGAFVPVQDWTLFAPTDR